VTTGVLRDGATGAVQGAFPSGGLGAELCFAIIGPSQVRISLSMRMQATTLCHTEMAGELTALRAAIYSTVELVLGCSPSETSRAEVVNELVAKF
jgi:hypothetical protein